MTKLPHPRLQQLLALLHAEPLPQEELARHLNVSTRTVRTDVATLNELSEEALIQILKEPKNALTKQYQALFSLEGAELEFRDEALDAIAKKAMARKTGARGLRSIVEAALLDTMYDLPSMEDVEKVVIDESVIAGQSKPLLIYGKPEAQQASGE